MNNFPNGLSNEIEPSGFPVGVAGCGASRAGLRRGSEVGRGTNFLRDPHESQMGQVEAAGFASLPLVRSIPLVGVDTDSRNCPKVATSP